MITMETALFRNSLSEVIRKLKEILIREGFLIGTIDEQRMSISAYRNGNWFRTPRQLLFELSPVQKQVTRMEVTAYIQSKKKNRNAEERIEERMVAAIYRKF
jgi:hypothetical protein